MPNLNVGRFVWTADNHITFIWLLQAAGIMGYPRVSFSVTGADAAYLLYKEK